MKTGPKPKPLAERFWPKVRKTEYCWEWVGMGDPKTGYGKISVGWKKSHKLAHRAAYELANGPIPEGMFVLHRCDNRACVRPDHLFLGTAQDNTDDMRAKGRDPWAVKPEVFRSRLKLTEAQVIDIRRRTGAGEVVRRIALEYGVDSRTIRAIRDRQSWRHVPDAVAS